MIASSYPYVLLCILLMLMMMISHNQIASILFDQFIVLEKAHATLL